MKGLLLFFPLILSVKSNFIMAQEKPNFLVIIVDDLNDWIENPVGRLGVGKYF